MTLDIRPHANGFGACIHGPCLNQALSDEVVAEIRQAWLRHQVVYFEDQPLTHDELSRFTLAMGAFGINPYVAPTSTHRDVLEVRREPDEAAAPFGSSWHSDWSFQAEPPSATILHAKEVPPHGGDTHFADGVRAWRALDPGLKNEVRHLKTLHSARRSYSREAYDKFGGAKRSMTILPADDAWDTQEHPLVRTHPETGAETLWINPVYTIAIVGMNETEGSELLKLLITHSHQEDFVYQHKWSPNMLCMWDNRSVQHAAQGGYDGHRRIMHRTVVAGDAPF